MTNKKTLTTVIAALAMGVSIAACGGSPEPQSEPTETARWDMTTITPETPATWSPEEYDGYRRECVPEGEHTLICEEYPPTDERVPDGIPAPKEGTP